MPIFGRKGMSQSPPPPPPSPAVPTAPGHAAVLARLRESDADNPRIRLNLAGRVLFDLVYQMISNDRGARIEDMLAILASTGGYACIVAALHAAGRDGATLEAAGIVTVESADGRHFLFGDLPNRFLLESELALLSLALGGAQACGGQVSLEMVHQVMKHVAGSVGTSAFGVPVVPSPHEPGDLPSNYVRHLWSRVVECLDLYEVPVEGRPAAIGFAIQHAIDAGKQALDPTLAARIVVECAVPMAKLDPRTFA